MVSKLIDKLLQSKIINILVQILNLRIFTIEVKVMDLQLQIIRILFMRNNKMKNSLKIVTKLTIEIIEPFQIKTPEREMNGKRILDLFIIKANIKTNLSLKKGLNLLHQLTVVQIKEFQLLSEKH
jgi:hypothetical protein